MESAEIIFSFLLLTNPVSTVADLTYFMTKLCSLQVVHHLLYSASTDKTVKVHNLNVSFLCRAMNTRLIPLLALATC